MKYTFLIFFILTEVFINCQKKALVLFFSRAGENYSVGKVEKGNTERFVDSMKSTMPSSTVYHKIEPENEYPESYSETLDIAENEQNNDTRPNIKNPITDVSEYDPIIIGYPIWHTKIPRIVINQIEKINSEGFKDKNIVLICTHEGSGFSSTMNEIQQKITNSKEISQGKSLRGSEVDSKTSEIESFAKSIIEKYNIVDSPTINSSSDTTSTQPSDTTSTQSSDTISTQPSDKTNTQSSDTTSTQSSDTTTTKSIDSRNSTISGEKEDNFTIVRTNSGCFLSLNIYFIILILLF